MNSVVRVVKDPTCGWRITLPPDFIDRPVAYVKPCSKNKTLEIIASDKKKKGPSVAVQNRKLYRDQHGNMMTTTGKGRKLGVEPGEYVVNAEMSDCKTRILIHLTRPAQEKLEFVGPSPQKPKPVAPSVQRDPDPMPLFAGTSGEAKSGGGSCYTKVLSVSGPSDKISFLVEMATQLGLKFSVVGV